jgi:hypothetical protein
MLESTESVERFSSMGEIKVQVAAELIVVALSLGPD